ncbi:hypothetical protein F7Q99_37330 [Streptomyces kaniharaensis]|uniref:Secreted protein n=1 Tax=Streptomyces kaniharaensis TaxID=212423 RepID=A0A6N7L5N1_9ACTN|nr:hypothetical protein [Streptomyces kaniharaensis]MQS17704.1 hypothetical protein [Streptomyces kaniharaensis]
MRARIAAVMVTMAGIAAVTAGPATAASVTTENSPVACATVLNQPCVWQETNTSGVAGVAQVSAAPNQLTLVRVEVKTQKAWGSPWETVSSATTVKFGSARAVTQRVVTNDLKLVCATAGPALDAVKQVTTCTHPF